MLTVEEWIEELNQGFDFRREYGLEDKWAELEALFYAVHSSSALAGPNVIAETGDSIIADLTVPKASFILKATRPELVTVARVLEAIDNSLIPILDLETEIETATLHAFLWGTGNLKFGFDSEFGFDPEFTIGDELELGLTMTQFDKKGRRIEFGGVRPGMPWVKSCLPHDIILPYGVSNPKDSPWIAHRVIRHIDDIKADVKYENKKDLRPVMSAQDAVKSYTKLMKPYRVGSQDIYTKGTGKECFVELFEIHDRRTGHVIVIATGHKKFLRNGEDLTQIKGLPFIGFSLVPHSRNFWVTPDAYYLRPYQVELSDISRVASKQRRACLLKFLYAKGAFEDGELLKVFSPNPNVGVMVNQDVNLREAILPMTPANNNISLYNDAEYIRRNARTAVGFSNNQMGDYEHTGRRTATEAMAVQQGASKRLSRRQKIIGNVYIDAIKKINDMIFEFWKTPRFIEVAGPEGAQWMEFVGSELRGDYSYSVSFTSEETESKQQRGMKALQFYTALSQDPTIDPIKLREYLINAMGDKEFSSIFGGLKNMPLRQQAEKSPQTKQPPNPMGRSV